MKKRFLRCGFMFVLVLTAPASAFAMDASTKEVVRSLVNAADTDYNAGNYEQALGKLQRAYDAVKVPTIGLLLGKTYAKLGQLMLAYETFRQVLNFQKNELWVGTTQEEAQAAAEHEAKAVQARLPLLAVRIEGADAAKVSVLIDGVAVPRSLLDVARPADPGKRRVVGKLGEQVVEVEVELAEGERKDAVLSFAPQPAASVPVPLPVSAAATSSTTDPSKPSSAQRTWGWVTLGVGAAGLAVGTAAGIVVLSRYGNLKDQCDGTDCTNEHWSDVDSYSRLQTVSTVGFVVGGLATAAGITLLLTSPKEKGTSAVGLWMAPASAGLRGSF